MYQVPFLYYFLFFSYAFIILPDLPTGVTLKQFLTIFTVIGVSNNFILPLLFKN